MTRLTWRSLVAHRRRFVGTFLAALLGVAVLTGTLVLGDTLSRNFDQLFAEASAGTDVVVRSTTDIKGGSGPDENEERGLIDASLLTTVKGVDGVAHVEAEVK